MALLFARRPGGQAERQFDREAGRAASCQLAPTKGKRREQIAEEAVAVTVARRRWLRQVCTCKPVPDSQLAPDHDHRGQPTAPTQHTHAPWAVARSTAHKNTSDVFDSRTCVLELINPPRTGSSSTSGPRPKRPAPRSARPDTLQQNAVGTDTRQKRLWSSCSHDSDDSHDSHGVPPPPPPLAHPLVHVGPRCSPVGVEPFALLS